ncbi:type II toxin-antitoxin system ParD family antitoxin [Nocardia sp. NPDC051463]|uniref:type II toxin-antitoxin system ParD family antitoxin n=1 Tax=Nocardia sp. NPDC051463 TaxID=3154845 RepID=UPI00344E92E7
MERNQSELEALRDALAAGEDSGPSTEFDVGRRIDEFVAQATDTNLISNFRAGRLIRSCEPADVSELP